MNLVENYESRYQTDEKTENKKTNKYNCSLDICVFFMIIFTHTARCSCSIKWAVQGVSFEKWKFQMAVAL